MNVQRHCCEEIRQSIQDVDTPIIFFEKFFEYGVLLSDGGSSYIQFLFCPWCGTKLPESLRHRWFAELERLCIDPIGKDVPEEFQNEQWYLNSIRARS